MRSLAVVKEDVFLFWTLQAFDLLTTLVGFKLGAVEANGFIRHFFPAFGVLSGLLLAKILTSTGLFLMLSCWLVKPKFWTLTVKAFTLLICWNTLMILGQAAVVAHTQFHLF